MEAPPGVSRATWIVLVLLVGGLGWAAWRALRIEDSARAESDVRLFVTLVRFDAAYHGLFKCNLRRLADYPNLTDYLRRMLALPGVAETVSLDHIKRGYYSIKALNPTGIVPVGPAQPLPLPAA